MPSPTTLFVPFCFSSPRHVGQEPKSVSDTPTGAGTGVPTGTAQTPGVAGQPQGPAGPAPGVFDNPLFLMLMVFVAVMLFTSMRRDGKAKKAQAAMLASIKQGDRIITTSGMHGIVHKLDEKTVTLRVDSVVVTFERAAIARVERDVVASLEARKA